MQRHGSRSRLVRQANALRKAHNDRIAPEVEALRKQYDSGYVNPDVQVSVSAREDDSSADAKETLNVAGAAKAFVNSQKEIVLVFAERSHLQRRAADLAPNRVA